VEALDWYSLDPFALGPRMKLKLHTLLVMLGYIMIYIKRGWRHLCEKVHSLGAVIFGQISSGTGRQGREGRNLISSIGIPLLVPAESLPRKASEMHKKRGAPFFKDFMEGPVPREATIEELEFMEGGAIQTAELCKKGWIRMG